MRLDPAINIGQLLIAVSFVSTGIGLFYALRGDVNVHAFEIAILKATDAQQAARMDQIRRDIVEELRTLNTKLDAIKERQDRSEGPKR